MKLVLMPTLDISVPFTEDYWESYAGCEWFWSDDFMGDEMKNSTVVQIALIPSTQDQDSDLLDQIFGFEPESHASVSCPHCGSLVSYFSDLEFHNCSGEF